MNKEIKRESMVFYDSFFEAIKDLDAETFKNCACAILEYGFSGKLPQSTGFEKSVFVLVKPQIDKNNQRWENAKKKGSRAIEATCEESGTGDEKKTRPFGKAKPSKVTDEKISEENNADDGSERISLDAEHLGTLIVADSERVNVGEYSNISLSPQEKQQLTSELGEEKYNQSISFLSRYIRRKPGYKSACHYEDLRGWVQSALRERQQENTPPSGKSIPPDFIGLDFDDICEKP